MCMIQKMAASPQISHQFYYYFTSRSERGVTFPADPVANSDRICGERCGCARRDLAFYGCKHSGYATFLDWNQNKGVKIGYFLCIITEKSINCETPTEYYSAFRI